MAAPRLAVVCRPRGNESRARAQHQPAAAGNDSAEPRRQHQRAAPVSRFQYRHAVRDDRHVQVQQPADADRAPLDARRRVQRCLYVLANQGRWRRAQRSAAECVR